MIRFLFSILLFIAFIGFFLFMTPLPFLLKVGNVSSTGLSWSNAYGTMFTGGLDGVKFGPQKIGDIRLKLDYRAILKGRLQYTFDVAQGIGDIDGNVYVGVNKVGVEAMEASVRVAELVGMKQEIRDLGGTVEVDAREIIFSEGSCVFASGDLETDALSRAAETYGRQLGLMTGILECDGPMLNIPMEASSDQGDEIDAKLRVGFAERSTAEAQVRTEDAQVGLILLSLGFSQADGAYHFRRDRMIEVGL